MQIADFQEHTISNVRIIYKINMKDNNLQSNHLKIKVKSSFVQVG
jgi:hypothetical protein